MRNPFKKVTRGQIKRLGLGVILFFVIFTVVGFFALPPLFKALLVKQAFRDASPGSDDSEDQV